MAASPDPRPFACARAGGLLDSLDVQRRRTLKTPDADQVHDLRVATRRFSQALVILESCFRGARGIRKELKPSMTLAGQVRDFDIVLKILGESGAPAAAKIVERITRDRAKSQAKLTRALRKMAQRGAIGKWRSKLTSAQRKTATPVRADAKDAKDIKQAVQRAAKRFFDRGGQAYGSPKDSSPKNSNKDLHRLRIATKKLRYTLELAIQSDGTPVRKHDQIEQLQSDLGDIHDFESVREIVSEYRGAKKLLGPLAKKQRKRIRQFRVYWKKEFGGTKNHAGWMRRIAGLANLLLSSAAPARLK